MRKRDLLYPTLLFAIFILFITEGDRLFGYVPEPRNNCARTEEIMESPEYEYISRYVHLSHYDSYFREAADSIGLDWTFLAAIAHTESRFDSTAVSVSGAKGVMQMMPGTLRAFGVPDSLHADNRHNIHASARYIKELFRIFRFIKNPEERLNFVLASYNAGHSHIYDAIRIAGKCGFKKDVWKGNVDSCLTLKSLPEYYNDSTLCRYGRLRDWKQTHAFVKNVTRTWSRFNTRQQEYMDSVNTIIANDTLKRLDVKHRR